MPTFFTSLRISGDPLGAGPFTIGIAEVVTVLDDDDFLNDGDNDTGNQFSIGGTNFTSTAYPQSSTGVELYSGFVNGQPVTFGYLTAANDGIDDTIDRIVVLSGTINPGDTLTGTVRTSVNTPLEYEVDIPSQIFCFTPGTFITTPKGAVLIENLEVGDLVITADNGLQAIRWIGHKYISGARLQALPHLQPVRIKAHAFGPNKPDRDLLVSPQHRMHLKSKRAQFMFGETEILSPAKGLLNDKSVLIDHQSKHVDYIHILFDNHELVLANGAWSESFHPGECGLDAIEKPQQAELFEVFPELRTNPMSFGPSARHSLSVHEIHLLMNE
jgi:hypothetical protein